jgi:mono/diheme cytochrome c family protein
MNRHSISSLTAFPVLALVLLGPVVSTQEARNPGAAALKNPVAATPESIAAGKKAYDSNCASCHGNMAQGAERAGIVISIIQEQGGKQAPDLTDDRWDHGSTDGEIYTVIKKGVPPTMMAGWDGRISDTEIWSIVNYIRALAANENVAVAPTPAAPAAPRKTLELADYIQMPITGEPGGENTRGQLARVNFLREEPGGRRFFVNDLNGPLYILDKKTRQLTTYLDFNGLAGRPGLFSKLTFERNFATGLINVVFDPDYARNGVFYTIHMEDPTTEAATEPKPGVVPGLDLSGYRTTPAIAMPTQPGARITREAVMIEWTDRSITNTTFEGTARELLRMQLASPIHPLGEMTFNPTARRGDPDWRVMYVGVGDSGTGEQRDIRRLNPQRLDNFAGKILRIVADLREHTATSTVSENGRYRIPNDNPFAAVDGARKEIWASGLRNPHRLVWDVDAAQLREPRLLAFNIGLTAWETVVIVKKGANYGYPLREGPQAMTMEGMVPVPTDDTIPVQITDTVTRGTVKPEYPVIAYPHTAASGGDAIAGGFIYRGRTIPALKGTLVFGDITTGRIWYAEMADVLRADDGDATTVARIHELGSGLRRLVEETFRARGGQGDALPGAAAVSGRGRVDVRFAEDSAGELYVLTKSDGMIRQVVDVR